MLNTQDPGSDDVAYGSTIAKRRLSSELIRMRGRERTTNRINDLAGWTRGKLGRMEENRWVRPAYTDIEDLLRVYEIEPGEDEYIRIMNIVEHARVRAWWRKYKDSFDLPEFVGYEQDCSLMQLYSPHFIPALLQTEAYSERRLRSGHRDEAYRKLAHETLFRRQRILFRDGKRKQRDAPKAGRVPKAPTVEALISPSSILAEWGTDEERRDQIRRLLELSQLPHIHIQMPHLHRGWHPGMSTIYYRFEFPTGTVNPPVAFTENDLEMREATHEQQYVKKVFTMSQDTAMTAEETTAFLSDLADKL